MATIIDLGGYGIAAPSLLVKIVDEEDKRRYCGETIRDLTLYTTRKKVYSDLKEMGFDEDQLFQLARNIVKKDIEDLCKKASADLDKSIAVSKTYLDILEILLR